MRILTDVRILSYALTIFFLTGFGLYVGDLCAQQRQGTGKKSEIMIPRSLHNPQIPDQYVKSKVASVIKDLSIPFPDSITYVPKEKDGESHVTEQSKEKKDDKKSATVEDVSARFMTDQDVMIYCRQLYYIASHPDLEEAMKVRADYFIDLYNASLPLVKFAGDMTQARLYKDQAAYTKAKDAYAVQLQVMTKAFKTKPTKISKEDMKEIQKKNYIRRAKQYVEDVKSGKIKLNSDQEKE